ncbi:MBL fold metallo-hydrolase [Asanoa sp. NPDC050611]|uniref:MBL fold metallo-hydrolase n=1 Tax=Asanoa sp. NPDC050611 TaxID=3157098 RepID=UPI0033E64F04
MELFKYTHACVRVEAGGRALLVDPGVWAEATALDGVSDILVTHEHPDHVDVERIAAAAAADPTLKVYAHGSVAAHLDIGDSLVAVAPGDQFEAAGFRVRAVGGKHAEISHGLPDLPNVGFVIDTGSGDDAIYHPGDAFYVPDMPVATLLVPTGAPWLKLAEVLDFIAAVRPRRAYPIHDALLSEAGQEFNDWWLDMESETDYARIPVGESITLT